MVDAQFVDDIQKYYEHHLPFNLIFEWLNHSMVPTSDFTHREFAFEYASGAYQRYNSFKDAEEFKSRVVHSKPMRFEIGAVYPIEPKDRKSVAKSVMKPQSKELVLDIDLTDYDEIRTCCSGTSICEKCWKFITLAIEIVDIALREDFGIEHRIWVFSGRRGVHCWISDSVIRNMNEKARRAFIEYLDVLNVKGKGKKTGALGLWKPYHPHIERSLNILKDSFVDMILKEQNSWKTEEGDKKLANIIPDFKLKKACLDKWDQDKSLSSTEKWIDVSKLYEELKIKSFDIVDWKKEVILMMLYPRLDVEVSRQMNHLLKSPFCVHPGTGNVCIPFDPVKKPFDPFTETPKLQQILSEHPTDWKSTSIKESVLLFKNYVSGITQLEISERKRERQSNETLDF